MSIIQELVKDIPIPKMLKVRQTFDDEKLNDVEGALREQLNQAHIRNQIKPGMEIAIAVGSRGVDKIVEVTAETRSEEHTSELQSRGHLVCRLLLEKKNMIPYLSRLMS